MEQTKRFVESSNRSGDLTLLGTSLKRERVSKHHHKEAWSKN